MSDKATLDFICNTAIASNSSPGFGYTAMPTTINFILSTKGGKVMLMRQLPTWRIDLNTFMLTIGPKTCGKPR